MARVLIAYFQEVESHDLPSIDVAPGVLEMTRSHSGTSTSPPASPPPRRGRAALRCCRPCAVVESQLIAVTSGYSLPIRCCRPCAPPEAKARHGLGRAHSVSLLPASDDGLDGLAGSSSLSNLAELQYSPSMRPIQRRSGEARLVGDFVNSRSSALHC